jgi:hypothetical protein
MKPFDLSKSADKAIQRLTLSGNIITLSGNQGSVNIDINGHLKVATFDTDLATTAENFVQDNYDYYRLHGFKLSAASGVITVDSAYGWQSVNTIVVTITPYVPTEASPTTTLITTTGGVDLTAVVSGTLEVDFLKARIWKVGFSSDIAVANPVNPTDGDRIRIELTTTDRYTVTWGSKWDFAGVGNYVQRNVVFCVVEGVYDSTLDKVICDVKELFDVLTTTAAPTTPAT